jgi:tetratricopeptide (TPR) repeat protein
MDVGKIDQFCQKIESMIREISSNELGLSLGVSGGSTSILMMIYRAALDRYISNAECAKVLEQIISESEQRPLQEVFFTSSEEDIKTLSHFAETFYNEGKVQIAAQLFQFLTLLCPNGIPYACTYMQLAEAISELNIDTGLQIYDFILNIFPDNPAILLAAAQRYGEGERPKRALRLLAHAKEVCEHNVKIDPSLQKFLDLLYPELEKVQRELAAKE